MNGIVELLSLLVFFCGLWAAAQPMLRKQEDKREEKKATKTMEERKACGLKESVMNEMERQAS